MLGPHNREDAEFCIAGHAPKELDHSVVFFVGKSVASNEVGSDSRFAHCVFCSKNGWKRLTDMLPDGVTLIKQALVIGPTTAQGAVSQMPRRKPIEILEGN